MEGVGSSGHEPYLTPAGLRISSVRQVKIPVLVGRHEIFTNFGGETRNLHQFWWGRHEISTSFGGGDTKSPPVLVGEARNLHQFWWKRHENLHQFWWATRVISTNHGDRLQKNKPPGYRHRDMTSTQSCAALKSTFPQAIIKCVIVFLQPAAFRDKQVACQTTGGRRWRNAENH